MSIVSWFVDSCCSFISSRGSRRYISLGNMLLVRLTRLRVRVPRTRSFHPLVMGIFLGEERYVRREGTATFDRCSDRRQNRKKQTGKRGNLTRKCERIRLRCKNFCMSAKYLYECKLFSRRKTVTVGICEHCEYLFFVF